MAWASATHQPWVVRLLRKAISTARVAHAYLFAGTPGAGQFAAALDLASALHCQTGPSGNICETCAACRRSLVQVHPDTLVIQPDGAYVKREQVVEAQRWVALRPANSPYRVLVVQQADLMTTEAANAALKILEEPPAYVVFVLIASNTAALLPTIRSRCQQVVFPPIPPETICAELLAEGVPGEVGRMLAALSGGSLERAHAMGGDSEIAEQAGRARSWLLGLQGLDDVDCLARAEAAPATRGEAIAIIDIALLHLRDALLQACGAIVHAAALDSQLTLELAPLGTTTLLQLVDALLDAREALGRNANVRLTLDVLMLGLATAASWVRRSSVAAMPIRG